MCLISGFRAQFQYRVNSAYNERSAMLSQPASGAEPQALRSGMRNNILSIIYAGRVMIINEELFNVLAK